MRKILLSVLLATAISTPAMAQRHERNHSSDRSERADRPDRSERSERRSESREERSQRPEPKREKAPVMRAVNGPAVERPTHRVAPDAINPRAQVTEHGEARRPNVNRRGRPTLGVAEGGRDSVANWRERERTTGHDEAVSRWAGRRDGRVTPPAGARPDRPAPPPATASHRDGRDGHWRDGRDGRRHDWRRNWRDDRRYDWRSHRRHHRSSFHLGLYFDPFGWGYHRYNVGWRLWPSYYGNRYWLNDPYSYRLPQAPWPYRWVRYYNDAMLVDTMSGEVVDVIYDFFW